MTAEEIIERMGMQGLRITEQRRTLAGLFASADGYLSPKDVYEYMGKMYSGLSFDTVYRNLRVLNEMDVLEQFAFEEGVRFRVHCKEEHHHHHLICLSCEKTIPLAFCPLVSEIEVPNEFTVVKHKFELFGYCKDCKAEMNPA